ncbi:exodeoxyribonuclease VII small subunit [Dehalococcoidia bacterium]|nr:exodeoxyribonuclease VII small subunit [Dehalococcoidia bacterium]
MNKLSFEEALSQLEEIVRGLEIPGVTLDKATSLFEQGMELANLCHQQLTAAELKVTSLQRSFNEQMAALEQHSGDTFDSHI